MPPAKDGLLAEKIGFGFFGEGGFGGRRRRVQPMALA